MIQLQFLAVIPPDTLCDPQVITWFVIYIMLQIEHSIDRLKTERQSKLWKFRINTAESIKIHGS